ncbi:MAG: hypothetical protein WC707_03940 [Candidatus Babeliaceae bacterium]
MKIQEQKPTPVVTEHDENILVVKRTDLFPVIAWHGLQEVDQAYFSNIISQKKQFLPRSQMELDPEYKQIIPYLIFTYEDTFFLMQRQPHATEQRLKSKMSLGIGGHIREEDITGDDIISWATREFEEEVDYKGSYTVEPLGLLNDDSNEVGKVHVGFVYLLRGDSPLISVKSELKSGRLVTLEECDMHYDTLETWSQIVVDFLLECSEGSGCCCSK